MKFRISVLAWGLFLVAGLLSGCRLLSKDPPAIGSLTLTDQVDERTKAPLRPVTSFPAKTSQFFASVKVLNPRKGTELEALWFHKDILVDRVPVVFDIEGDRYVAFNLVNRPATQPFPSGPYKLEIHLDGRKEREVEFVVEG